jgi:hypothetical protein
LAPEWSEHGLVFGVVRDVEHGDHIEAPRGMRWGFNLPYPQVGRRDSPTGNP